MVHRALPNRNFGSTLGQAFQQGFIPSFQQGQQQQQELFQKQQQESLLKQALSQAQQIYADPNLTPEQKQIGLYSSLSRNPEIADMISKNFTAGERNRILQEKNQISQQKQNQGQQLFEMLLGGQPQDLSGLPNGNINQLAQTSEIPSGQSIEVPGQKAAIDFKRPESWTMEQINTARSFAGQPGNAGVIGNIAENEFQRREQENKNRTAKEKEYFKLNEPQLMKMNETQRNLENEATRYARLGELFSDPSKFPSAHVAALFSKEGQLNDIAFSLLSPEAQEAVKLIIDSTSNIKDTYGARVTNFDLQTYLKKLPSLLNSHEGRQRVLRDLQLMNQVNQIHNTGIGEVFEEAGGTDKIPFSTAERRFNQKYGKQLHEMRERFVHPEKETFSERPNPEKYLGRKIKNPETGEIFISDGKEWKPFKG